MERVEQLSELNEDIIISSPIFQEIDDEKEVEELQGNEMPTDEVLDREWEDISAHDDQNQKIARLLDSDDAVVEIINSSRLLGLEICGLLL